MLTCFSASDNAVYALRDSFSALAGWSLRNIAKLLIVPTDGASSNATVLSRFVSAFLRVASALTLAFSDCGLRAFFFGLGFAAFFFGLAFGFAFGFVAASVVVVLVVRLLTGRLVSPTAFLGLPGVAYDRHAKAGASLRARQEIRGRERELPLARRTRVWLRRKVANPRPRAIVAEWTFTKTGVSWSLRLRGDVKQLSLCGR